ncbi:hypothetical protein SAMN06265375_10351 [Muriicola jejuensis]|uniref:DUF255 domain-containing protein n=1 Tax=Muriicola jejuensis TaxID=504488 RepID=A0A6P0UKK1_9FLAO|nr:thioredoxin domain-containing protein [Muriicola jejuensis]NER11583.1 DUF255 domain-containing protein [Muriicola jejuensis]SMP19541.1 hypothetical protein SAMN06265375_10351 [Muriicola jejuensis]
MNVPLYRLFYALTALISVSLVLGCKNREAKGEEHPFTNDLVHETSPYLLQHAHNPVNWLPWGEKALEKAREEEKLIIVSIGYSSCHWCHVMEEETFEDVEVAELMNEHFVSIKVDREERPDVDEVYMTAVQLMTGSGGWPLNVILLPNGKPLYGGTYHTKRQWMDVLSNVNTKFRADRKAAEDYADRVAKGVAEVNFIPRAESEAPLSSEHLLEAVARWKPQWDMEMGGNLGREKFIMPANLSFLLDYARLTGDLEADVFAKNTLDKILQGGIYDHVGGGFFRYSTDPQWKVPHFEKMLYDNAQLLSLFSKAYAIYKDPSYRRVITETAAYLDREMKGPDGSYFAAMDADSEGIEGAYYTWTEKELKEVLGGEFELFAEFYSIRPSSAWEGGRFVLYRSGEEGEFAQSHGMSMTDFRNRLESWHHKLLSARKSRVAPRKDDKIITSWNALLITGFVDAYAATGEQEFLDRARRVYEAVMDTAFEKGRLIHSYKPGSTREEGFLEDYAFMARAAFSLYQATLDTAYLEMANRLMKEVEKRFYEANSGLYRYNQDTDLISDILKVDDGVIPSPNAMVCENLILLGHLQYDKEAMGKAGRLLKTMEPRVGEAIPNYSYWARLMLSRVYPYYEIVTVGPEAALLSLEFQKLFLPNALVAGSFTPSEIALFDDRYFEGETFIYVCSNNTCKLPVKTVTEALQQLRDFRAY